jgi:hypothetical protein
MEWTVAAGRRRVWRRVPGLHAAAERDARHGHVSLEGMHECVRWERRRYRERELASRDVQPPWRRARDLATAPLSRSTSHHRDVQRHVRNVCRNRRPLSRHVPRQAQVAGLSPGSVVALDAHAHPCVCQEARPSKRVGALIRSHAASGSYSWMRPPSRSRRCTAGDAVGSSRVEGIVRGSGACRSSAPSARRLDYRPTNNKPPTPITG